MVKTNVDTNCDQCISNGDGEKAVSDEDKIIAWRSYQEKLLKTDALGSNIFFEPNTVSNVPQLIDKGMIGELISNMKNGIALGASGLVETVFRKMSKSLKNQQFE